MEEKPLASGPAELFARIDNDGFEESLLSEGILTTSPEGGLGGVSLSAQATITWVNDNEFQYNESFMLRGLTSLRLAFEPATA